MKRKILLVDDEVAVLLTLKAVLELNQFDVDTAASGREGRSKLRANSYHMVITDMRMESDSAGVEVISAARRASYHPAIALLTAFPIAEEDWQSLGADRMLIKPTHTKILLQQIEKLLAEHEAHHAIRSVSAAKSTSPISTTKPTTNKSDAKKNSARKSTGKKPTKILKITSRATTKSVPTQRAT